MELEIVTTATMKEFTVEVRVNGVFTFPLPWV